MADVTLNLGANASRLKAGLQEGKTALSEFDKQANKKGIFDKLNNDVKNLGGTFSTLRDQIAGGNFLGALATASKAGSNMAGGYKSLIPVLGGIGVAAGVVGASIAGMWSAMSNAKEMRNVAEQSGLLVTELSVLQKAFGRVGIDAEQVPQVMNHLRDAMATLNDPASKASKAFEKIGLSASNFEGKSYYESLKIISEALGTATNKTDALNAATAAFGSKKGMKVGQALGQADFGKLEAKTPESAKLIQDQGEQFEKFQIAITRLKPSVDGFFLGMASEIIPALEKTAATFEKMDLVAKGKKFGEAVVQAMEKAADISYKIGKGLSAWFGDTTKEDTGQTWADKKQRIKQAKVEEEVNWKEERKRQLIPGYAEAQDEKMRRSKEKDKAVFETPAMLKRPEIEPAGAPKDFLRPVQLPEGQMTGTFPAFVPPGGKIKNTIPGLGVEENPPKGPKTTPMYGSGFKPLDLSSKAQKPWLLTPEEKEKGLAGEPIKGAIADLGEAKGKGEKAPGPIMASLAAIGGGSSGMNAESLTVAREQLTVLRTIAAGITKFADGLKPDPNPIIGINSTGVQLA